MKNIFKVFLVGLALLGLTGCTISAKSYAQKTEPKFNEIVSLGSALGDMIGKTSVTASAKVESITSLKSKVQIAKSELVSLKSPSSVQGLNNDLNTYYAELDTMLTDLGNLVDFLDISETFTSDFDESVKALPSDMSKDLSAVKKSFEDYKTKNVNLLNTLNKKNVTADYKAAKDVLAGMLQAYIDFLNSVISAIDAKKSDLIKLEDFTNKIDKAGNDFAAGLDAVQNVIFDATKIDAMSKLEDKIKVEFSTFR